MSGLRVCHCVACRRGRGMLSTHKERQVARCCGNDLAAELQL